MANNTVDPTKRGATKFGRGISQVSGTGTPKRGGEVGLTRIRESFIINASSPAAAIYAIADAAMELVAVQEVHSVVGGSGATLTVEKLTGTTAPGSGTALTGAASLTGTINTLQTVALTGTSAQVQFAAGDRVSIRLGGTLTGLVGAFVLVFRRV
jgi:hypothetical protein